MTIGKTCSMAVKAGCCASKRIDESNSDSSPTIPRCNGVTSRQFIDLLGLPALRFQPDTRPEHFATLRIVEKVVNEC